MFTEAPSHHLRAVPTIPVSHLPTHAHSLHHLGGTGEEGNLPNPTMHLHPVLFSSPCLPRGRHSSPFSHNKTKALKYECRGRFFRNIYRIPKPFFHHTTHSQTHSHLYSILYMKQTTSATLLDCLKKSHRTLLFLHLKL